MGKSIAITGATIGKPVNYLQKCNADVWTSTWADDGNLYALMDDTGGWYGKANSNVSVCRIFGDDPANLDGETVHPLNKEDEFGTPGFLGQDGASWKGMGMGYFDRTLYLAVSRHAYGNDASLYHQRTFNAAFVKSTDYGATWTPSAQEIYDKPLFHGPLFSNPYFIDYGQNGKVPSGFEQPDGADRYIYAISNDGCWNNGSSMRLGRVLQNKLADLNLSDWSFYKGTAGNPDGLDDSNWTSDINEAGTILYEYEHMSMTGATYIPGLGRYVMIQWYYPKLYEYIYSISTWDFYESPHPWGPWSKFHSRTWETYGPYNPTIPSKFVSRDGRTATIFFNGDFMYCMSNGDAALYTLTTATLSLTTAEKFPETVCNPGFDKGDLTAWGTVKGSAVITGNTVILKDADDSIYQELTGLIPNTMYRLSCLAKVRDGAEAIFGVRDHGGLHRYEVITGDAFKERTLDFVTGLNSRNAVIFFTRANDAGEAAAGSFKVEPLILDGNFECKDLTKYWAPVNAKPVKGNSRIGSYSAALAGAGASICQTIKGLKPGTTYRITAYGRLGNYKQDLKMTLSGYGGRERSVSMNSTKYEGMSIVFKTGTDSTGADIVISRSVNFGSSYVDCVLLHEAVHNPDFESGTDGWVTEAGIIQMGYTYNPEYVFSGKVSGKLIDKNTDVMGVPCKNRSALQKVEGLKPDTEYILTAYARVDSGSDDKEVLIGVNGYNSSSGHAETSISIKADRYEKAEIRFKTGASDTNAVVFAHYTGAEGAAYFDGFHLHEGE